MVVSSKENVVVVNVVATIENVNSIGNTTNDVITDVPSNVVVSTPPKFTEFADLLNIVDAGNDPAITKDATKKLPLPTTEFVKSIQKITNDAITKLLSKNSVTRFPFVVVSVVESQPLSSDVIKCGSVPIQDLMLLEHTKQLTYNKLI